MDNVTSIGQRSGPIKLFSVELINRLEIVKIRVAIIEAAVSSESELSYNALQGMENLCSELIDEIDSVSKELSEFLTQAHKYNKTL